MIADNSSLVDELLELMPPIELLRIAAPPEAERLSSLDWDSIKRAHPELVVRLSERRVGMRVGHALMLSRHNRQRPPPA